MLIHLLPIGFSSCCPLGAQNFDGSLDAIYAAAEAARTAPRQRGAADGEDFDFCCPSAADDLFGLMTPAASDETEEESVVLVGRVIDGSAAMDAGLQAGDRLLSCNGVAISSWEAFVEALKKDDGGKGVVAVQRGTATLELSYLTRQDGVFGVVKDKSGGNKGPLGGLLNLMGF